MGLAHLRSHFLEGLAVLGLSQLNLGWLRIEGMGPRQRGAQTFALYLAAGQTDNGQLPHLETAALTGLWAKGGEGKRQEGQRKCVHEGSSPLEVSLILRNGCDSWSWKPDRCVLRPLCFPSPLGPSQSFWKRTISAGLEKPGRGVCVQAP